MSTSSPQLLWIQQHGRKAWQLKQQGWRQGAIAAALNVTSQTIDQWLELYASTTKQQNQSKTPPIDFTSLTDEQQQRLHTLLQRLPSDFGFQEQQWTPEQVSLLIQQLFDISLQVIALEEILRSLMAQLENQHPSQKRGGVEHSAQRLPFKKQHRIRKLQLWALDQQKQAQQRADEQPKFTSEKRRESLPAPPAKFKTGPPTKLSMEQLQTLPELLLKPPHAYGLTGTVWTYKQIALVIEQVYHVSFSPDYIPDFLKRARRRLEKLGT